MDQIPHDRLMCVAHWKMVPMEMRAEIATTFTGLSGKGTHYKEIKAYTDAVNQAVEHVSALEFNRITATAVSLLNQEVAA